MQYWINQNGVQSGPVTHDDLKRMNVTPDAYVWRSGLDDWVKITSLPELADLLAAPQAQAPAAPEAPAANEAPAPEAEAHQVPDIPEIPTQDEAPVQDEQPQDEVDEQPVIGTPVVDTPVMGQPLQQPAFEPQFATQQQPQEQPECPPTNLVWGILTTILCCMPLGIVGIIYATKVTRRYNEGDFKGAQRASETGAWWCIGSIIAGLAFQPLISLFQMIVSLA